MNIFSFSLQGLTPEKFTIFQSAEHIKDEHLLEVLILFQ